MNYPEPYVTQDDRDEDIWESPIEMVTRLLEQRNSTLGKDYLLSDFPIASSLEGSDYGR